VQYVEGKNNLQLIGFICRRACLYNSLWHQRITILEEICRMKAIERTNVSTYCPIPLASPVTRAALLCRRVHGASELITSLDPDCLQLVILFQSDLPTHTHTHIKLYPAFISIDVTTAPKLFWRRDKVFVDDHKMFALQVIYMKLNCVSKQYGTKLRCY
jgi:hypothetical protein